MKSFPSVFILIAMIFLSAFEFWHSWKEQKHLFNAKETRRTLVIAAGAIASNSFSRLITFLLYELTYQFKFFSWGNAWWVWALAFIASDLSFYWFHRSQHHINWFWASHSIHHSSTDFNLSISFRGPWFTADFSGKFLFWSWTSLLGFNPLMMTIVYELIKLYQFWLHTETI